VKRRMLVGWAAALVAGVWLAGSLAACGPQVPARAASDPSPAPKTAVPATPAPRPGPAVVGKPAPDFALPTIAGKTTRLSDLRGQVVLVNLWATWCPPCRMEVPELVAAYDRYKGRGFTVLAVNQGEARDQVQAFAGQYGMAFPVLLDQDGAVLSSYPTRGIPASFLVDRQGVLRQIVVGAMDRDELARLVEPLLGS